MNKTSIPTLPPADELAEAAAERAVEQSRHSYRTAWREHLVPAESRVEAIVHDAVAQAIREERRRLRDALVEAAVADLDLGPIKARAEAATPGPWTPHEKDDLERSACFVAVLNHMQISAAHVNRTDEEDAAFIAAARTDVPALVAKVERHADDLRTLARHIWCDACHETGEVAGPSEDSGPRPCPECRGGGDLEGA